MKECNKFIDSLRSYYNPPDLISAEEVGIRKGWRGALEWILTDLKTAREGFDLGLHDTIYEELNAKT